MAKKTNTANGTAATQRTDLVDVSEPKEEDAALMHPLI